MTTESITHGATHGYTHGYLSSGKFEIRKEGIDR